MDSGQLADLRRAQLRLNSDVAWLRFELAWKRLARKYSPDQPRDDRGRWTDGGGGGAGSGGDRTETTVALSATSTWVRVVNTYDADGRLARQTVFNRDGCTIRSEFAAPGSDTGWDERHTVTNPDGSRFGIENSGDTQTIRDGETGEILSQNTWTPDGPVPEATVQQVLDPRSYPAAKAVEALAALYVWLSTRNSADGTATIDFNAQSFEPGASLQDKAIRVDQLTREQVDEACPRHAEVQARTDQAADAVRRAGNTLTAQRYGTAVHMNLKLQIDALRDPNFRAEVSMTKSLEERYGRSGSARRRARAGRQRHGLRLRYQEWRSRPQRPTHGRDRKQRAFRLSRNTADHRDRDEAALMAPASQVKPLVAPLLARNADLTLVGRLLVIRPVHHILRGILIDRRGDPDRFQPMWFAYPLFCAGPEYYLCWNHVLRPGGETRVWQHSAPNAAEELSATIEAKVLPTLRAITTIAGFERFAQGHPQSHHKVDWLHHRPPLAIAQGDLATARRYCTEKIAPLQVASFGRDEEDKAMLRQLKELCRRLSLDDRAGLAALLHEWEATLVRNLKIEHLWKPTLFPLEEQEGTRS